MQRPAQVAWRPEAAETDPAASSDVGRRWLRWLLTASLATLALPVLVAAVPPLLDYPNHLVRLWLIAGGADTPPLSQMYAVSWGSAHTNVGIDYIGAVLGRLVPATALGSALVLLALLLPPLGAVALNRAIFGGVHWWQIGFAFFACNATLLGGFLNFHIGLGLALLGAASESRLAASAPAQRIGARLAIATALLLVHVFALAFYCALLAGLAFGRERPSLDGVARRVGRAVLAAAVAAIPAMLLIALAPRLPGAHVDQAGNAPLWGFSLLGKTYVLLSPITTYVLSLDLLLAAAILAPLLWALAIGRLHAHAGLLVAAGGLVLLALAAPTAVAGTWWIDNRFPIMALLALVAGTRPDLALSGAGRLLIAVALAGVVHVRSGSIAYVWHQRQADIEAVRKAVQHVPAGAAILPLDNVLTDGEARAIPIGRYFHNGHPTHWSMPVLAIMWRQTFVPNLFWAAGKQPLRVLAPWDQISFPEDGLLPWDALLKAETTPAHFKTWRQRYQYVLLLNADLGRGMEPVAFLELQLATDAGFARLYIVRSP
jgi:hypothetical protein